MWAVRLANCEARESPWLALSARGVLCTAVACVSDRPPLHVPLGDGAHGSDGTAGGGLREGGGERDGKGREGMLVVVWPLGVLARVVGQG